MTELHPTLIANDDGSCACPGCTKLATARRITRKGWFLILYCEPHERQANEIFGAEKYEAVA